MIIAILFAVAAIVFFCWLLFTLAIYALPFYAGVSAMLWALSTGAGILGGLAIGIVAGVVTLIAGQLLFAAVRAPLPRLAIALLFAVPASIAGYHAVHGLTGIGQPAEIWRQTFAWVGAFVIGVTAWLRLAGGGQLSSPPNTRAS
jgi:hypothetical protein